MSWNQVQLHQFIGRHVLYRIRTCPAPPPAVTAHTHTYAGRVRYSSTSNHHPDICSTLYISGDKGSVVDGVVSPYLDFTQQFRDTQALERSVSLRGVDVNVKDIVGKYSEWKELERRRSELEGKRAALTKTLNALKRDPKNKGRVEELKEHGRRMRNEVKSVTQMIWEIEETAVIGALSLPNNLHDLTETGDKLLFSLNKKPTFDFNPKSHVELATKSSELEVIDNSPTAYYLRNRLALLELACNEYFLAALGDDGFTMMSNADFVKSPIVEGCGIHFRDRADHNTLSSGLAQDVNSLHLVGGGSLQAFAAYFTKQVVEKGDLLPYKVMTGGRNYSPVAPTHSPGLLGCRQSQVVDGLVIYEDAGTQERSLLHGTTAMLIQSYLPLDVHFRVVRYSAGQLDGHESAALGVLMFSPHTTQYHEVARVSLCGDYISRRLWTICRRDKSSASFVSTLHVRACHVARLTALLVENKQEEDGSYSLPQCLESAVESFYCVQGSRQI